MSFHRRSGAFGARSAFALHVPPIRVEATVDSRERSFLWVLIWVLYVY
ncbi:hypothetical protein PF003_g12258 [Phytophthora fragariae]|nr:hypothetical protein PF003_g12258 [Phytophthora fragariae]